MTAAPVNEGGFKPEVPCHHSSGRLQPGNGLIFNTRKEVRVFSYVLIGKTGITDLAKLVGVSPQTIMLKSNDEFEQKKTR